MSGQEPNPCLATIMATKCSRSALSHFSKAARHRTGDSDDSDLLIRISHTVARIKMRILLPMSAKRRNLSWFEFKRRISNWA